MGSVYEKIKVFSPPGYPTKITLTRRKSGETPYIYFYFTINGKPIRQSTHTTSIERAERYSTEKFMELHRQKGTIKKILTFEKLASKFIEYKEQQLAETRLSPKTFNEYKRQCKFLVEKYKGKTIDSFAKQDFNEYKEWRKSYYTELHKKKNRQTYTKNDKRIKGRLYNYSMETIINRELGLLKSIILFAKNELELSYITKIPTWDKYDESKGREILTDEEFGKLQSYWEQKNLFYWYSITFVSTTGIRYPSEMYRLKWKDVDLEQEYIIIRDRKGKTKRKGNRDMTLPIINESRDVLVKLRERENIPTGNNDYVFLNDSGKRIYDIKKAFHKSLIECGITDKHITMYSLRHYFTTRMLRNGMPVMYLASILGHTTTAMIEKHYGKIMIIDKIKVMKETLEKQGVKDMERKERAKEYAEMKKLTHFYEKIFTDKKEKSNS